MTAVYEFPALGTTAAVAVTEPAALERAVTAAETELAAVDAACSRFRPDSELMTIDREAPVQASPLLAGALAIALRASDESGGLVDPIAGCSDDRRPRVSVDPLTGTVRIPEGVTVDLGATGKAMAADRCAARAEAAAGCGVLVSLGGDLAVAGPAPHGGWPVGIADSHRAEIADQTVALRRGALATSSVTTRSDGAAGHHILDPRTGRPANVVWRTVSVAACTCVAANTQTTAAIVAGVSAVNRLRLAGVPARLVAADGRVTTLGGWPQRRTAA